MEKKNKTSLFSFVKKDCLWKINLLQNWIINQGFLQKHASIERIEGDSIILSVDSPCLAHEFSMNKQHLILQINNFIGQAKIKNIVIKNRLHKELKPCVGLKKNLAPGKKISQPVTLSSLEKQALAEIKSPDLKQSLEAVLIKCKKKH